ADYERRQTLTGAERYVTAELKEHEAKILSAEETIGAMEERLFGAARDLAGAAIARIQDTATRVATADVLAAFADAAVRERYVRPALSDDYALDLEASRHPVVERMMPREAFIPNDVRLDPDHQIMI